MGRDWSQTLAVLIVGAITGAIIGTLLGGVFGTCLALFCAFGTGDWNLKGMSLLVLEIAGLFSVFGQVFGAMLWFRFWTKRGRPPRLEEMGLTKLWGKGGLILRTIGGAIIGAIVGVILGIMVAASLLGAIVGKSLFGPIGGALGAEIGGMVFTSLFLSVVVLLAGTKHRTGIVANITNRIGGEPGKFGTFTRAYRGALHGAKLGAAIGFMIVIPALLLDLMTLLQAGIMMTFGMVLAGVLTGAIIGVIGIVLVALEMLAKEPKPLMPPPVWGQEDEEGGSLEK